MGAVRVNGPLLAGVSLGIYAKARLTHISGSGLGQALIVVPCSAGMVRIGERALFLP